MPPNKALQLTSNSGFQSRFGSLLAFTLGAWAATEALLAAAERRSVGRRELAMEERRSWHKSVAAGLLHFARILQMLAEGFSVLAATLWPASLTIEFLVGPTLAWGPETLIWSLVALVLLFLVRRDVTRLAYLVGPFALLSYTMWVGLFATVALIRGSDHRAFIPVAVVFVSLFVLIARWIERLPDDLGGIFGARRPTRRCS